MPTFSENYESRLPRTAPDWLRDWAERREWKENALLWRADWLRDPMTGIRERAARTRCTACGTEMWLDYFNGGACGGWGYGPTLYVGGKQADRHKRTECPECGAEVWAEHLNGATEYAGETAWPMTLHRIASEGRTDRLALVLWRVWKYHGKDAARRIEICPWEACVAEEGRIARATRHAGGFNYYYPTAQWHQCARFSDGLRDVTETVCPEGVAEAVRGTTAENAKLELYLRDGAIRFPASWLRIWQKHPNAETLMTGGAAEIVANLIGQEKTELRRGYRETYGAAIPTLKDVRWKEKRPSRMLGMDRGELREAAALQARENLGGKTWQTWLRARAEGRAWTLEDLPALEALGRAERWRELRARPAQAVRYLEAQKRRHAEDGPDAGTLLDYWSMLAKEQPGEQDREALWPERLKREHDRLVKAKLDRENSALDALFAERAGALAALEFHAGGLFITPPRRQGDLAFEGKALHHCVAHYAERHAKGQTAILFIRREEAPDEPFFTLEWNEAERRVVQNRGSRNRDRTPEVAAFEAQWLAWIAAGAPKERKTKTRKENDAA